MTRASILNGKHHIFFRTAATLLVLSLMVGAASLLSAQDLEPLGEPRFRDDNPFLEPKPLDLPWLELEGGLTLTKRTFTVDSVDAGLVLDSSFYGMLSLQGAAFPFQDDEFLKNFGVIAGFGYGVDTTVTEEGGVERRIPTRHLEAEIALAFRTLLENKVLLQFDAGLYILDFVLSDNPFYGSTKYRAGQISARGTYFLNPQLQIQGGLSLVPFISLGESEAEFGQSSDSFGASVELAAEWGILEDLYIRPGYRLRWFSTSFQGVGQRQLEAVVTTDVFHHLVFWAGYRL